LAKGNADASGVLAALEQQRDLVGREAVRQRCVRLHLAWSASTGSQAVGRVSKGVVSGKEKGGDVV